MDATEDFDIAQINAGDVEKQYKQLIFNSSSLEYVITQDIVNEQGILLVTSGKSIAQNTYEKILEHKLLKPLDDYLRFTNQLTPDSLLDSIVTLCESLLADTVYDFDNTINTIRALVSECDFDNTIMNKLTVFSNDRTDNFNHSIATAFIATEIGKALRYSNKQLADLFSVALLHDIGEIFIDPTLNHRDVLSNEEFKAIKVHPVVSHVILKESNTAFSKPLLDAVLNHHEQINGQGYPRGLSHGRVGALERILAVADTFEALQRKNRTIDDILWILKSQSSVNSIAGDLIIPTHDPDLVFALTNIIRKKQSRPVTDEELITLKKFMQSLFIDFQSVAHDIDHLFSQIEKFIKGDERTNLPDTSITKLHGNVSKLKKLMIGSSGVNCIDFNIMSESETDLIALRRDMERLAPELLSNINTCIMPESTTNHDKALTKSLLELQNKMQTFNRLLRKRVH